MLDRPEATRTTEDQGCMRWVLGVPLVIIHLIAAWFCYTALAIQPAGIWDDDARAGIVLSCVLTIGASALALLITVAPSVRRAMGPWWLAPPLILGVVAAIRWASAG
ncbi:hypothetical protein [Streptomyces sp. 35G-GA-8]|uniref:hypothetical protein n=1 Tax=Streptomyces sp. 35G-GA-8 TaxID=2939434 RepID=UPI00201FA793|nr:hypothetical protein [Streptomyces sp. 35G-GA-8]MCL7381305.1 hypothetical protein [Streptomyces sp. 35G-GA-8]